jgi:hypothetical protein
MGALDTGACMPLHARAEHADATARHSSPSGSRCMIGDLGLI